MKIKMARLLDSFPILERIYGESTLDVRGSFWFSRQYRKIHPIVQDFRMKIKELLDARFPGIPPEHVIDQVMSDMAPILDDVIEIDIEPKPIEYLTGALLKPVELDIIAFLFE